MSTSISIIIVTWNGLGWLKSFLPSVVSSLIDHAEVIVADNASTDGTADWVRSHFPQVKVQSFDQNYGYCGGNNRAAAAASGKLLIFLNNDVEVGTGWLKPITDAFNNRPTLGAAQPKILAHGDRTRFEYAGAAGGMMDRYGYPFCLGRVFDTCEIDTGQYDHLTADIFWASGAALAIRRDVFLEAGGFDEDFQFHMEEIDLCWKLHRMGYTVSCIPESVVYHVGGGSLDSGSARKLAFNMRNNLAMLYKHLPAGRFWTVFMIRSILDGAAAVRELLRGRFRHFWAIASAADHFLLNIGGIHKKRRVLIEKQLPFKTDKLSPVLLPWRYFVMQTKTASKLLGKFGTV